MLVVRGASGVIEEIEREMVIAEQSAPKAKNKATRLRIEGRIQMAQQLIATFKNATVLSEEEFDAWRARLESKRVS